MPRNQWTNSGGFCGSLSTQTSALSFGAYLSQDIIRRNAPKAGGHGNPLQGYEILHTNIEATLENLHLRYESWECGCYFPNIF